MRRVIGSFSGGSKWACILGSREGANIMSCMIVIDANYFDLINNFSGSNSSSCYPYLKSTGW